MCYTARHFQASPGNDGRSAPDAGQHRPRWAGAAAAAGIAGLAFAASLLSPTAPPVSADEARLVEATVVSTLVPASTMSEPAPVPVAEQVTITTVLDDGTTVPVEDVKAGGGACAHDL